MTTRSITGRLAVGATILALLGLPSRSDAAHGVECAPATTTVQGSFDASLEGDWVMVPFDVPAACHRVGVELTHEQVPAPDTPIPGVPIKHTLDLAVYQPSSGDGLWGRDEFRGYGGSGQTDVSITEGGATTRGFTPGPIPAGTWAAELGAASIASMIEGDLDGKVDWTLTMSWSATADTVPWNNAPYPTGRRDLTGGPNSWWAGDVHVHGPNSNDAPVGWDEMLDVAFDPARSNLDFIALSDHNVTRQWSEIGVQPALPADKLVIRSEEVTTYRGHVNSHAAPAWIDYRTGTVWEWEDGPDALHHRRYPIAPGAPGGIFDQIQGAGGLTQVNHPTTFPSLVPGVGNLCRGCPWEYSDAETDWSKVDLFEVGTGPGGTPASLGPGQPTSTDGTLGPNPFTPLAIEWFDRLQRAGYDVTAVGSSDSHRGDHQELTQSPIGEATTVVKSAELSEAAIMAAVEAGHAYVKFFGNDGPDLRFTASPVLPFGTSAIMGDELRAVAAVFSAEVITGNIPPTRPGPLSLHVFKDGVPILSVPIPSQGATIPFVGVAPGDYRLQLMRGTAIEAMTNPINLRLPTL